MASTMEDEVFATVSIILLCTAMKLLKKRKVFLDSGQCPVSCIFLFFFFFFFLTIYYNGEFKKKIEINEPIRNKNCLRRPCLLTDRNEMSNLYRGPAIDASYQVSIHLAKRVDKHGRHMPFLFLIGRFLKIFFSVTA
jgi:hypothetical protein